MPSRKAMQALSLSALLATACSATAGPSPEALAEKTRPLLLASPFAGLKVKSLDDRRMNCPAPPAPFTGPLDFPSKYEGSGKARDVINEDAEARYKNLTRPMEEFEAGLTKLSDRYVHGQAAAAQCALDWMQAWAKADALMGEANMTGKAVRKWTLAATAFSFLKIQDAPGLEARKMQSVRDWMVRVANTVIDEHNDIPQEKLNNHYYWAGAAVGAAAIATQDRELLDWALDAYRTSVAAIDKDGVLPREMARRSRALNYHIYALQPLVMLAEIGRVNGVDLYAERDCAICRLINRVAEGVRDPTFFAQRAGARQVIEANPDGRAMIWVAILARACPDDEKLMKLKAAYQPFSGRRLGGNLTDVYENISKELPNAVKSKACSHLWR
ncbi:MAG: algL [Moraxellaceae bacterium]|nr:algL [Moraxellaceae bacterium]